MHFLMGTGIYGQVKQVGPTPIVTKFVMLQLLPVFPLQSIYATGPVETTMEGIPFIACSTSADVDGFPLARIDWASAAIGYCRALCTCLFIAGSLGVVLCLTIKRYAFLDQFGESALFWLTIALIAAVAGGALSYLVPLTNRREAAIRLHCGDILDGCIDPAKVNRDFLPRIEHQASRGTAYQEPATGPISRLSLIRELIACRLEIAMGNVVATMEASTDDLLNRLKRLDH